MLLFNNLPYTSKILASPSTLPAKMRLSSGFITSSSFSESSESEKCSSASAGISANEPIPNSCSALFPKN